MTNNIWFLTEERPKKHIIENLFQKFATDNNLAVFIDTIRIIPILKNNKFTFTYEILGLHCSKINKYYIKTVTGNSSFVDYLMYYQELEPTPNCTPVYAIEVTKTDDKESRNTGVYQRCSKFVFIEHYYPNTKKIMLYDLQIKQKEKPTDTYIFGTRLLLTLGVEIIGKELDANIFTPFNNIKEIIKLKKEMRNAPKGNVPISISKNNKRIEISGRLIKNNSLSHDPNIGAISIISAVLRKLGWNDKIIITSHGLNQSHLNHKNKFALIANKLNISLSKLTVPHYDFDVNYWKYDYDGEKIGTIFIHLIIEEFSNALSIFENHAGSEKGYFFPIEGEPIPIKKYKNRELYKSGDKKQIIEIPDLIVLDRKEKEIINIEGEKYINRNKGILQIKTFDFIEKNYISKYYPNFKIVRTVVLFGGNEKSIVEIEVGFLLNSEGELVLGINSPKLFRSTIKNLLDFWG